MPIRDLQHSRPDKESCPVFHTYALFYHCLCVRYGHHNHFLDDVVRSFSIFNARPPDIIQSPQTYKFSTSVVRYTSQCVADCLISCEPHFSSSGDAGAMTCPRRFPCTCTSKGSEWYAKIRLGGDVPRTQRHPSCCARDYLVDCRARVMVLVEADSAL
jgi:hypothetical protein